MTSPTTKHSSKRTEALLCLLLAMLALTGSSCTKRTVYSQYQTIDRMEWNKEQEFYFTFMIEDARPSYDIMVEVRHSSRYPYQNLWLFYSEEPPVGDIRRDTMECVLADEFGQWLGDGIALLHPQFPVHAGYRFPMAGQYTYSFRQGMRNDTLVGIQAIALRVEKVR